MVKSLKNIEAFGDFKSALQNAKSLPNGDLLIYATIRFTLRQKSYEEVLPVKLVLNGIEGGTISIEDEGEILSFSKFHSVFRNQYGDISFDESSNTLSITGQSKKLGEYLVTFREA